MIKIHRERATSNFLGIKNENWQAASRDLGAHALRLYLYLAANADNYSLALSPADIRQTIGMPQSTYRDQFQILVDKGYLVSNSSNGFDFFEVPKTRGAQCQCEEHATLGIDFEKEAVGGFQQTQTAQTDMAEDREINNINNRINNETNNELYPQRIIRITPPTAEGKKRPQEETKKTSEFKF